MRRSLLLREIRRHSERPEDAHDALADACVQFLSSYSGPSEGDDPLNWMLRVGKRRSWDIARRRRTRERILRMVSLDESHDEHQPAPDTAELVERKLEVAKVAAAIDSLAPDERTALLLLGLGFGYEEIGRLRGWSYTKVNRCINEGRSRVREILEGGENF